MWEPFGTVPANATTSWRSGPTERGTLSILSSCIITLLLCAYTSLHLDIPEHRKAGWRHQTWRRAIWVLVGLLAPEGVAFIAFESWVRARALEFSMTTLLGALDPKSRARGEAGDLNPDLVIKKDAGTGSPAIVPSNQAGHQESTKTRTHLTHRYRRYPWTRVHSQFALMGGYAVETNPLYSGTFGHHKKHTRQVLTPVALRTLARNCPSRLPDISREFIRDKSKANSLAKLLVCVQACWFIAQTTGRLAVRLPISLLELNTLLHAVCCLLIYVAWWHKPLDIEEPYLLDPSDDYYLKKVIAWMIMKDAQYKPKRAFQDDSAGELKKIVSRDLYLKYEGDFNQSDGDTTAQKARKLLGMSREENKIHKRAEELMEPHYNYQWRLHSNRAETPYLKLYPGQRIHGFVLLDMARDTKASANTGAFALLSRQYVDVLILAHQLRQDVDTGQLWKFVNQFHPSRSEGKMVTRGISMANSPDRTLEKWRRSRFASPKIILRSSVLVAGSLYGGLHLFAWNGPFPNNTQRLLWQISCFVIISPLVLILVVFLLGFLLVNVIEPWMVPMIRRRIPTYWQNLWNEFSYYCFGIPLCIFSVLYIAARLYLVVECFINIAYLPEDVFKEPQWSRYIPHFGAG